MQTFKGAVGAGVLSPAWAGWSHRTEAQGSSCRETWPPAVLPRVLTAHTGAHRCPRLRLAETQESALKSRRCAHGSSLTFLRPPTRPDSLPPPTPRVAATARFLKNTNQITDSCSN